MPSTRRSRKPATPVNINPISPPSGPAGNPSESDGIQPDTSTLDETNGDQERESDIEETKYDDLDETINGGSHELNESTDLSRERDRNVSKFTNTRKSLITNGQEASVQPSLTREITSQSGSSVGDSRWDFNDQSKASRSTIVSKGSSGIAPRSLPLMTYELRSADNYEEWRKSLEAYGLANNSWTLIFEPYDESLKQIFATYSSYRTIEDIKQAHKEWCGKLFGIMYQSVMKLTGDVLLGELRALQHSRTTDVFSDPYHLKQYISNRYEKLSSFSRINDFMKVFSMTYDPNQNPAELREKLLAKIIRFQNGDQNRISEDIKLTIIYNTIPSNLQPLIRGYIPDKINITFDDIYNALKTMYDERKSKSNPKKESTDLSAKERKVLSLLRNPSEQDKKRKFHCWYCDSREHSKFLCPKVNEDRKKGKDVSVNPFKPKDLNGREKKKPHVMSVAKQQRQTEVSSDEEEKSDGFRYEMCIISLEKLETHEVSPGFVGQIIDHRILNSKKLHLDSGAFMHITSDRTILINIRKLDKPIPLTGAFGQQVTYVKEVGDIVLNMGVRFREVGIVPNAHMTLISEARIQEAGYGINKPPGKAVAQIYQELVVDNKFSKKIIMEFAKDRLTDLWTFTMEEGNQTPQERFLEKSGMVRFKPKKKVQFEDDVKEDSQEKEQGTQKQSEAKKIPKKGVSQKGGSANLAQLSAAPLSITLEETLPKNKRKRK